MFIWTIFQSTLYFQATLADIFCCFCQILQANAVVVPCSRSHPFFFLLHMSPFIIVLLFLTWSNIICADDITLLNEQRNNKVLGNKVTEISVVCLCVCHSVIFCFVLKYHKQCERDLIPLKKTIAGKIVSYTLLSSLVVVRMCVDCSNRFCDPWYCKSQYFNVCRRI
jgi:hypothetical protein